MSAATTCARSAFSRCTARAPIPLHATVTITDLSPTGVLVGHLLSWVLAGLAPQHEQERSIDGAEVHHPDHRVGVDPPEVIVDRQRVIRHRRRRHAPVLHHPQPRPWLRRPRHPHQATTDHPHRTTPHERLNRTARLTGTSAGFALNKPAAPSNTSGY